MSLLPHHARHLLTGASLLVAAPAVAQVGATPASPPAAAAAAAATQATPARPATPATPATQGNPLVGQWATPDGVPPYDRIRDEHYEPAFTQAMAEHRQEIDRIARQRARPTFANTIEAMERSGALLTRVGQTFSTVASADARPEIRDIQQRVSPLLTRHGSAILTDQALFRRVDELHRNQRRLRLTPEQARLLDVTHRRFVRAGAALSEEERARVTEIDADMSAIRVAFGSKLLAAQRAGDTFLSEPQVAGLSDALRDAARAKAEAAGRPGMFLINATRPDAEPFLTQARDRAAREAVWRAFTTRGDLGENDTSAEIARLVRLRLERAQIMGQPTHAHFSLQTTMAETPEAAMALLRQVYDPALEVARREEADLLRLARADGLAEIQPWDWLFYAERVRQERFAIDEAEVQRYFPLDGMVDAMFDVSTRLWGLTFHPRDDIAPYAEGVRVWEVREADGRQAGLFYGDFLTRPTKRPGAWMNEIRGQDGLTGARPIVVNNSNFIVPAAGQRATLSMDDTTTLFHEWGHGLHGILSNTRYPGMAGTRVYRDFVELPSQLLEHWVYVPEVLQRHALNEAGQPMPPELLQRLIAARTFNQGFRTVQQLSSALVDMELHLLTEIPENFDQRAFERQVLAKYQTPPSIGMRHRLSHFSHLFDGGYDAGYYSYTWSEVLDADAFDAFTEAGGPFDTEVARRFRANVLETGNSRTPQDHYIAFRGRMPDATALLRNRGLLPGEGAGAPPVGPTAP